MTRTALTAAAAVGLALSAAPAAPPEKGKAPPAGVQPPARNVIKQLDDGSSIDVFTLVNGGLRARVLTYGGILTVLQAPDRDGKVADVVLGFDELDDYLKPHPYFGALVGRVANRVGNARFTLDGKTYKLFPNNPPHSLHGGKKGFDKVNWHATAGTGAKAPYVELKYESPDGEEGYPGTLETTVTYWLYPNELRIEYRAHADKETPVNLTHHSYFNLGGHDSGDVLGHEVQIEADEYTPSDKTLLPTGAVAGVGNSPLDFRAPTPIGKRIEQLKKSAGGYDHNYVLRKPESSNGAVVAPAARVREPKTGRVMEVLTSAPGMQFYTGNFLDGTLKGKRGAVYKQHAGFCLEAQHYPDSPNKPDFPTVFLKPGQVYAQTTIYRFTTDAKK